MLYPASQCGVFAFGSCAFLGGCVTGGEQQGTQGKGPGMLEKISSVGHSFSFVVIIGLWSMVHGP